jgi:tetratricopeptide (TPR) repeat protein
MALITAVHRKPETEKKQAAKKGSNSYYILSAAFIFAIIVILLILNSNSESLSAKIQGGKQNKQVTPTDDAMPSMPMMQEIQELKTRLEQNPNDYDLNVRVANNYFDISQFDKAIGYYHRALKVRSDQTSVLIDLGVCYFNRNQSDSALYYIDRALVIKPDHPQGLYNKGVIYFNMQKNNEARSVWEKLVSMYPDTREAQAARDFLTHINEH